MREIKFRAISIKSNVFKYGNLYQDINLQGVRLSYITGNSFVPVISMPSSRFIEVANKTIGQYTGLKDKNGVEIYEGDILLHGTYYTVSSITAKACELIEANTLRVFYLVNHHYKMNIAGTFTKTQKY